MIPGSSKIRLRGAVMKCPFCGHENIKGVDTCESCNEDLTQFDGTHPKDSLEQGLVKDPILDVAKCNTWAVSPETPLVEVAEKLGQDNQCCLVVEGKKLIGIVTVRDILQKVIHRGFDLKTTPIKKIMTPNPDTLTKEDKLVHALNKMSMRGYRHVPILKDDGNYQVISVRDIISYLAQKFPQD